jgi:hypothetical protein
MDSSTQFNPPPATASRFILKNKNMINYKEVDENKKIQ